MIFSVLLAAAVSNPYGVCAHVTRTEKTPYRLAHTVSAMKLAGMGYVRADIDSAAVLRDGKFDFAVYDRVFDTLGKEDIAVLPILNGRYGKEPPEDFDEYREYLGAVMTHYKGRFSAVEIWNEANLNGFFTGADPERYAETLKTAYETVKRADPSVQVAFTGTAGVPLDWIRRAFDAGAGAYFDVMNVHPYSHPRSPEGDLDVQLERLKSLMAEYGLSGKPIWLTEVGWPTHDETIHNSSILLAGLKIARPAQKAWKMLVVDCAVSGVPDQRIADLLLDLLPAGSSVEKVNQVRAVELLRSGGYDAVVYPFDESFPADTVDAVNRFIDEGGVFVDMGGLPCYFGMRGAKKVDGMQHGGFVHRFPFGFGASWTHPGLYPASTRVFATGSGLAAGVKQEPTGFVARRFIRPDNAGGHEWIPLVASETNGAEIVAAGVIRYKGERKGAAVLCSLYAEKGIAGTNDEENQARYTARALAIAFAEGAEAFFTYNLRAEEIDPNYSEHHFGLMHRDFQPKPAYSAYAQFTRMRPPGSVNVPVAWHDPQRVFYYPQWNRPDGKRAGMIWQTGEKTVRVERFSGGRPVFFNMYGRVMRPRDLGGGRYSLTIDGSPVYFAGAELAR